MISGQNITTFSCQKTNLDLVVDNVYFNVRTCTTQPVKFVTPVPHLHFMTILKSFYCPVMAYMDTLLVKEAIPFI